MTHYRIKSFFTLLILSLSSSAFAVTIWDESVNGDLSTDPAAPTPISLDVGINTIIGSDGSPGDPRDFITFEIGANQLLTGILLQNYTDVASGGPGNRGFTAINEGDVGAIPAADNMPFFLAGALVDPFPAGTNLLDILENDSLTGTGLTGPLGPGVYTFLIQQTSPLETAYTLDFQVTQVPLPGALFLFAGALLPLLQRKRKA